MATYVLVHGAWHGGWVWRWVRKLLEQNNHQVFTPTMAGLGERAQLMSKNLSIDTLVTDIENNLRDEELQDVILVGHSFGGVVISGVAERLPSRIKQLIYLDAVVLEDGESIFDCMHPNIVSERKKLANESSNGMSLPIPSAEDLGIFDDSQWEFVKQRLTPQPLSTYSTPLTLKQLPGEGKPCTYIVCTNPSYLPLQWARKRVEGYGWPIIPIESGHDAMISAPEALSKILMEMP
ncbi:MAG: alpha/beta fold hydrolase [Pseudohongiellaceae bacterium]